MSHLLLIGIGALASIAAPPPPTAPAPPGTPNTLYCLRVEPITGSHIPSIVCLTREQWAEGDVDVDRVWARDGVRVIA